MSGVHRSQKSGFFFGVRVLSLVVLSLSAVFAAPPDPPTGESPADGASGVDAHPMLCVDVSDPDGDVLDVTFYGRRVTAEDFTIVVLPDTQNYSQSFPEIFRRQTEWCVESKDERNIVFVSHLGDIVQTASRLDQWDNAESAMSQLEDPLTTNLPDGMPYGLSVGNHDQSPLGSPRSGGDEGATTVNFNDYFGVHRFDGRDYYGGHYDFGDPTTYADNNDNNFELFSAGGMDFIAIHLEYDLTNTPERDAVLDWLDNVLLSYPERRAIIVTHYMLTTAGTFSGQGSAIYEKVKDNPNVFLMMGGHVWEAARRSDEYQGNTIHSILSDYQNRANGGNGWLRVMTFSPGKDEIFVQTYSPWLDQYEPDEPHQFTLSYDMEGALPFDQIDEAVRAVPSGGTACLSWPGRRAGESYDWFVEISDGSEITAGPVWSFTSDGECIGDADCVDFDRCTDDTCLEGICEAPPAYDGDGDGICADVDNCKLLFNPAQRDTDADGFGDLCDICPNDPSPIDSDEDGAGDACDCEPLDPNDRHPPLIDGLLASRVGESVHLSWPPVLAADVYSISRGDLGSLATGEYGTCFAEGLFEASFDDAELPADGDGFFYLIQAQNLDCGLGSLGHTSDEIARDNLDPLACEGHAVSDAYATNERVFYGTVSGSFNDTALSDDVWESITEEVSELLSTSILEHRWTFELTSGRRVEFHVEGFRTESSDGDDFRFEYSLDGLFWMPIDLVSLPHTDNGVDLIAQLPETLSGLVLIRVVDTERGAGNTDIDTIYVDEMFIRIIP
ncbi:MAG: hypothetical protein JSV80_00355 [Acidobacteriota bacterium]|nr:MAG: hypothetical protein JSV80_00355 [Acidobacteriota bacterium]